MGCKSTGTVQPFKDAWIRTLACRGRLTVGGPG
jgi:hypothetical protein